MCGYLFPGFSFVLEVLNFILVQTWTTLINSEFYRQEEELLTCCKSQRLPQFDVTRLSRFDPLNWVFGRGREGGLTTGMVHHILDPEDVPNSEICLDFFLHLVCW